MITELYIKKIKGEPSEKVNEITLESGAGVQGDIHSGSPDRGVCLVTGATALAIAAYREKYNCMKKFSPNVVLSGGHPIEPGGRIIIGDAVLAVTAVGRECHGLCDIPACPLISGIIFARIERGGTIKTGDTESYA